MCLYLKNNSVYAKGIITTFNEKGFSFIIPDYELERVKINN